MTDSIPSGITNYVKKSCNTYTSGSSTCTRVAIFHGGPGAGCGRGHPACGTYGSRGEIVREA